MQRLLRKLEDIMVAVTFAEAGEFDEANRLLNQVKEETPELTSEGVSETA